MPFKRLKFTYDYCKSNIPSFILVLLLIFITDQFNIHYQYLESGPLLILMILAVCITLIFHGYGLVVTKDNINNGHSLPKLPFYRSFILGLKSTVIMAIFTTVQIMVFLTVSELFTFPFIEVNEGNIAVSNMGSLFYEHGSLDTILFFMFVIMIFYISTFFLEISLARLADKGGLREALNMASVAECINTIGWGSYTIDYTKIIVSIAILSYIKWGLNFLVNHPIIDLVIGLLIFIIQYIGIGRVYRTYKEKKYGPVYERPRRRTLN